MDQFNKTISSFTGGNNNNEQQSGDQNQQGGNNNGGGAGGFLGGLGDKINSAAGGGRESEKNEDYLDKGEADLYWSVIPHADAFHLQASTTSRRTSWVKASRTTSRPWSRYAAPSLDSESGC